MTQDDLEPASCMESGVWETTGGRPLVGHLQRVLLIVYECCMTGGWCGKQACMQHLTVHMLGLG